MLKSCDFARIVLSVLWLVHSYGPAISIIATTQNIRPTAEHESADRVNSSSPRRVTVLTKIETTSRLLSQPANGHPNSNPSSDSSSTASNENYVGILSNHSRNADVNKALESGFQPLVPDPAIDGLAPKFDSKDVYFNEFDGAGLKWGLPASVEHSHQSTSNDYPSYNDVPSRGSFDASYSKYHDSEYSGPPKTDEHSELALSIYKQKMKPLKGYLHENPWENNVYSPDHNFVDGFTHQKDHLNVHKAVAYNLNKIRLKSSLLHILTTLIPFGLLLSALPPKVVIINSTNSVRPPETVHEKGTHIRMLSPEFLELSHVPVNDTMNTATLSCKKLRICEAALRRNNFSSSFEDYNLKVSNDSGVDSNLQDILEAVARRQCSKFTCEKVSPTAPFSNDYE